MALQESGEMYLETIYVLSQEHPNVRAVDIGEELGYSRPSVSRAMHVLKEEGLVKTDEYGFVKLTEAGNVLAKRIYERHTLLTRLFIHLGVDEKTATEDACRIEHYISDKTFDAIKAHMKKYEKEMKFLAENARENNYRGSFPSEVAETILKAVEAKNPKSSYTVGLDSMFIMLAAKIFPQSLINKAVRYFMRKRCKKY